MIDHAHITDTALRNLLRAGGITLGGNRRLKIFGRLDCGSGKRMKRRNRVFFTDQAEAEAMGYRPCGHCMKEAYQQWICSNRPTVP